METKPKYWKNTRIGITGANGSLGKALTKKLRERGAFVIGLTHRDPLINESSAESPQQWIKWSCGNESNLSNTLENLDVLIINHGINPQRKQSPGDLNQALEVNALSCWRLIEQFEHIVLNNNADTKQKEIWINTSEAEIQPALSPAYELSKRLIGQLVSLRWNNLTKKQRKLLRFRKLVLGPFVSDLNPFGIMTPNLVAKQVLNQAELNLNLIIVTPNPITYVLMPITELFRSIYYHLLKE